MKNTTNKTSFIQFLRQKAEDILKKESPPSNQVLVDTDTLKLFHEIEVQKIELELQNEELMEALSAAREAADLYDFAPTAYYTLAKDGKITNLNLSGASLLHSERNGLKGQLFESFVIEESKQIFNNFLQSVFKNKTKETCEISLINIGKAPLYVFLKGVLGKNEEQCLVTSINISERKQIEATLQQQRELYLDIVNNQNAGIYRIRVFQKERWLDRAWNKSKNPPYIMEFASDRFCEILGISHQDLEINPGIIIDLIHMDDKSEFVIKNEEANNHLIPFKWDGRLIIRNKVLWVHLESTPRQNGNGEIIWTGTLYDFTIQKQAENDLIESENKYRELVDNSPDAIAIYSEGKIVFVNKECLRLMGSTLEKELLGKPVIEFIHPDFRSMVYERMSKVANEKSIQPLTEEKFIRLDGTSVDVVVKSMPIFFHNKQAVQLIVRDNSTQKNADNELSASREEFKDLFDNAPVGYHEIDTEGRIIRINQTELKMLGYSMEELIGQFVWGISDNEPESCKATQDKLAGNTISIQSFTRVFRRKDGSTFPVLIQDKFLRNDRGLIIGIRSTIQDITEHKKSENEINKSREDFKDLFDNAPVGYHEIDTQGKIVRMNQTELNMLGYTPEEINGQYIWKIAHNESQTHQQVIDKLKGQSVSLFPFETILISKTGIKFSILILDKILYGVNGNITGIRSTIQDISEIKKAENELITSREEFVDLFNNAPVGYHEIDTEGRITRINQTELDILGYTSNELIGKFIWEISADEKITHKSTKDKLHGHSISETPYERKYIKKNKQEITVLEQDKILKTADGTIKGIRSSVHDITERKRVEENLRISELRFRDIFENSIVGKSMTSIDGIMNVNKAFSQIVGYSVEELSRLNWTNFTHNDDVEFNKKEIALILEGAKSSSHWEKRYIHKNGNIIWVDISTFLLRDNVGNPIYFITETYDITERKQTEKALLESEELYRNLVLRIPDGVYKSTSKGRFIDVNPAMVKMLGYKSKEELMAIDIKSQLYFDINDRESLVLIEKNEEIGVFQLKKKDGTGIWIEDHGWYNTDSEGKVVTHEGVLRDITERKIAQDALQKSESMLKRTLVESTGLIDITSSEINYERISDTILELSGAKYVSFNIFNDNGHDLTTVSVSGIKTNILQASRYFGFEVLNKTWKFDPVRDEKTKNKTITRFESLNELSVFSIPKSILNVIEKTFNFGACFIVKITKNNKTIGDFTLIFSKGEILRNTELISLFANQVGLYIDRDKTDKALRINEEKYRYLFENNPQPMYIYDVETMAFLEVNLAAIEHYGYSKEEFLQMTIKDIRPSEDIPKLIIDVKNNKKTHKPKGDWRHVKKNGEIIFVDISTVSISSNGKKVRHVMIQDITERKRAEDNLKESVSLLNATIESTADGILVVDTNGKINLFNQNFIRMWKVRKELQDNKYEEPMLDSIVKQVKNQKEFIKKVRFLYSNPNLSGNDQIELLDGRVFDRYSLPHRIGETIVGRVWSFRDISLSKMAEEALRISEEKFRSITEQIDDFITICDGNGIITYGSPASKSLFQYEPEEMVGHHFMEFIHKESVQDAIEAFRAGIEDSKKTVDMELKLIRKDGSVFYGELNGSEFMNGSKKESLVLLHDISKRKKTLKLLTESEEKFRSIAEQTNDLISIIDTDGVLSYASKASESIFQYKPEEMCGHNFMDFLPEESKLKAINLLNKNRVTGENVLNFEIKMKRKDGSTFYSELNTSIFKYGDINGGLLVIRDISERKKSQEILEEKMNELMRFHNLTVGREMTMIELKIEINKLLTETGQKEKYKIVQ